jgi:hypothetical protein
MSRQQAMLTLLLSCAFSAIVGCNDNGLAPVSGRVFVDDKPIENAAVLFQPADGGIPATGVTDANGNFKLTTTGVGDGATLGPNGVSVVKSVAAQPNRKIEESEIVPMKYETPVKYASPKTSGITVDVQRGMKPVELKLTTGK